MLVKFGCGCIGFPPQDDKTIIVKSCGSRDTDLTIQSYDYILPQNRQSTPLTSEKEGEIFRELSQLVADGIKFREMKVLLMA